ncbi:Spore protein SP21 [Rubripirellula lacrimiformis]|uniref:Spore protein SP21 n=2 Tax=Rubripirellula lacrimiformis TaxID=1930273 RepID=A0A517N4P2_9BACT|nr:Spore protein SP21 [Rubripirellula lacrimiformis]
MANTMTKRGTRGLSLPAMELFPQFRSMENMMSRMFDDTDDSWLGGTLTPTLDVSETDSEVDVKMDLPGMKPEQIDIQVHNNVLSIRGERSEESEKKGRKFHRVERRIGSFARSVSLPSIVDEDNVDANYNDGVLTIRMPKTKEAQAKKIAVNQRP